MNILVDTGVWYAFCDPRDRPNDREAISSLFDSLRFMKVIIPWPVVYETVRTRFSKNFAALMTLEVALKRSNVVFIDDTFYRDDALRMVFDLGLRRRPPRPLSMIDCLLRLVLDDVSLKIDRFATFNDKDFSDVCRNRTIEMVR